MTEPQIVALELHENGDIQITWHRPNDQKDTESTFHTTLISREGLEADENLAYWTSEIRDDSHEFLMAWLQLGNRAASLTSGEGQHQ